MPLTRTFVVLVGLVVAGCSIEFGSGDPAPTSTTARITTEPEGTKAEGRLLSAEDILAIEGAPSDLEEAETDDVPLYENPDPRGPCGAEIDMPRAGSGDFASFAAEGLLIMEGLFTMAPTAAANLVRVNREDIDPNCPPFTSQTNTSAVQNNEFLGEVELPAEAGNAVATMSYIRVEGGLPAYAEWRSFRRETHLA